MVARLAWFLCGFAGVVWGKWERVVKFLCRFLLPAGSERRALSKTEYHSPRSETPIHATLALKKTTQVRKVALCDFLTRRFLEAARQDGADQKAGGGGWGGAKGGEITIDEPGQHILERSSVVVHQADGAVEARFTVGMPARGVVGGWVGGRVGSVRSVGPVRPVGVFLCWFFCLHGPR